MMNTRIYTGVTAVGSLVGGITLGTLLASRVPLTGLVRTFSFTPHMIPGAAVGIMRSEEHTSELQSRFDLVCRLLLEKKKYLRKLNFHSFLYCFTDDLH